MTCGGYFDAGPEPAASHIKPVWEQVADTMRAQAWLTWRWLSQCWALGLGSYPQTVRSHRTDGTRLVLRQSAMLFKECNIPREF